MSVWTWGYFGEKIFQNTPLRLFLGNDCHFIKEFPVGGFSPRPATLQDAEPAAKTGRQAGRLSRRVRSLDPGLTAIFQSGLSFPCRLSAGSGLANWLFYLIVLKETLTDDRVPPLSMVYNFIIEGNDKIVGFDSIRRRKSPPNEGFTGNLCDSILMF